MLPVDAILRIADLAQRLLADVASLEVNPLRVSGTDVEGLDLHPGKHDVDPLDGSLGRTGLGSPWSTRDACQASFT